MSAQVMFTDTIADVAISIPVTVRVSFVYNSGARVSNVDNALLCVAVRSDDASVADNKI
jgi:hypothetical protein